MMMMGLWLAFGVSVYYTMVRSDRRILKSERKIELHQHRGVDGGWDLDADQVHVAWHLDDRGIGQHFDAIKEQSEEGDSGAGSGVTKYTMRNRIDKRMTSFNHIAEISRLKDVAPAPFDLGPSGADERTLFESMHHKYKRETSASYERFASAWAERVLEERRKEINGETFLNLRLKTIKMLYEEHDRRYIIEDTINDMTVEDRQRLHSLNR